MTFRQTETIAVAAAKASFSAASTCLWDADTLWESKWPKIEAGNDAAKTAER
jgi:hypothetical protein